MRKQIYLLFLLSFIKLSSQTGANPNPLNATIDMYPKTPEAAALSKFVDIPAGNYTGVADFKIPLYTIEFDGQKIPIELQYNTTGITVGQIATRVGLGWVLNTGPSLSQQVIGTQDRSPTRPILPSTPFNPDGSTYNSSYQIAVAVLGLDGGGQRDVQPDIFTYNLLSTSGKFILSPDGTFGIPMPYNQTKINTQYAIPSEMIDEKGFSYSFFKQNTSTKTKNTCVEVNPEFDFYDPSFRISTIKSPKNHQIKYIYSTYPNTVYSRYISSIMTQKRVSISGWFPPGIPTWQSFPEKCINKTDLNDDPLAEIHFDGGKVLFIYNNKTTNPRLDLNGDVYLTNVLVKNDKDEIIKDFTLNYDYFTSLSSDLPQEVTTTYISPYNKGLDKRLKLVSVKDNLTSGTYSLEYYETYNGKKLPIRISNDQDYWGIYNGKENAKKAISISRYDNVNIQSDYIGADKNPDINYGKLGNLKKITYPTGGYSEIYYEADDFDISDNPLIIYDYQTEPLFYFANDNTNPPTKISFTIDSNSNDKKLIFNGRTGTTATVGSCSWNLKKPDGTISSGTSSGILSRDDSPGNYELWIVRDEDYPSKRCNAEYQFTNVIKTPIETLYTQKAGTIRVSKIESVDNNNGKIVRKYTYKNPTHNIDNPIPYTKTSGVNQGEEMFLAMSTQKYPLSDQGHYAIEVIVSNNPGWQTATVRGKSVGYDYVQEHYIDESTPSNSYRKEYKFKNDKITNYHDPTTPLNVNWPVGGLDRGLSLEETLYDSGNNLVKKIVNEYQQDGHFNSRYAPSSNTSSAGMMGYGLSIIPTKKTSNSTSSYIFEFTTYPLTNSWISEKKTTITDYTSAGDSLLVEKTNFYSSNYNHTFPSEIHSVGSKGEMLKTINLYPQDITSSNPQYSMMQSLITKNQISTPVITKTSSNNVITSEIRTLYDQFNSGADVMTLPQSIYLKKGEDAAEEDRKITYNSYDIKGNLTQYTLENGTPVAVIWGYDRTQPIAKVAGASYAEAYSYAAFLILASDVDNNPSAYNSTVEQAEANMINNMDAFRKTPELSAFQITTYSYDPLIGVKTMTPPSGMREYYFYDTAGRLESIKIKEKDSSGNEVFRIIKEYQYHYKQP